MCFNRSAYVNVEILNKTKVYGNTVYSYLVLLNFLFNIFKHKKITIPLKHT